MHTMKQQLQLSCLLEVLVIQLGSNSLPARKNVDLILSMGEDLMLLYLRLPRTTLIWWDMLEWWVWRGAVKPGKVDLP